MLEQARLIDWSTLQFHLMWIYEGPPSHTGKVVNRESEYYALWLVRRGSARITGERGVRVAEAGQWMVRELGPCSQEFSEDAEILSVNFKLAWPTGQHFLDVRQSLVLEAEAFPRLERTALPLLKQVNRTIGQAGLLLPGQRVDIHLFLATQARFIRWMEAFTDAAVNAGVSPTRLGLADERVIKAANLLERWPLDRPFDQSELERETGLTIQHLDRLFAKECQTTPGRYFDLRRLEQAKLRLATTSSSIKEIAYQLGFNSQSHFARWFGKRQKATPKDYRQHSQLIYRK